MAGALVESNVASGRRSSCRRYQSVLASDRFTTVTSWRMCSTSCAYHSGKVSLSPAVTRDRKSTRLNSSHGYISYAVFCLKKKKKKTTRQLACTIHVQPRAQY